MPRKIPSLGPRLPQAQDIRPAVTSWRTGATSSAARLYGYQWQVARREYLREHPLCVMCKARGEVTAATVVDHVIPHRGDAGLFWNRTNWQPLCKTCHDGEKARAEHAQGLR